MMNLDKFPTMPLRDQVDAVRRYGDFIGSRRCYGFSARLYAMPGFYAEIFYGDLRRADHVLIHAGYEVLTHYAGQQSLTEGML